MHAGVDHITVAPVIFFDAPGNIMRVGDKIVHPVRGALIPLAQLEHLAGHDRPHQRVGIVAVGIIKIPDIAGGRMAVADMHGVRPGDHALTAGRAGRNDHIVFRKIQCFKRAGHPRQHGTVQLGGKRQLLEIGGADIIILEPRRHVVFVIDEGIDGCIRENMVHTVHHAVCTGVCHQPVMHNGYLRLAVFHPQPSFGWLLDLFIVDHFAAKHGAE